VCSAQNKQSKTIYACLKCNMVLCVMPCFKIYHSKSTYLHRKKTAILRKSYVCQELIFSECYKKSTKHTNQRSTYFNKK
jgi:hypothetical protein